MGAVWTDGQARMARRVGNYERAVTAQEQWKRCPNCGSQKVGSDKNKHFKPTGSIIPMHAHPSEFIASRPGIAQAASVPPLGSSPSTARQSPPAGPSAWSQIGAFHAKHWRIIWAVVFLVAPFGSIGDAGTYSGPFWLDALKFTGILVGCWAAAVFFGWLHVTNERRKKMTANTSGRGSSPDASGSEPTDMPDRSTQD